MKLLHKSTKNYKAQKPIFPTQKKARKNSNKQFEFYPFEMRLKLKKAFRTCNPNKNSCRKHKRYYDIIQKNSLSFVSVYFFVKVIICFDFFITFQMTKIDAKIVYSSSNIYQSSKAFPLQTNLPPKKNLIRMPLKTPKVHKKSNRISKWSD
jgi:hypothetical protein